MSPGAWAAFLAAAAVGAPLRYVVDGAVAARTGGRFPWGTLVVNVVGSFVFGLLAGLVAYHDVDVVARTVAGTGFCGALTTFSTFTSETLSLLEAGEAGAAALNVGLSLAATLLAAAAGLAVAQLG
jgi:CrcB protein